METITTIFIAITGVATSIMAIPIIQKKWVDSRAWRWKKKMRPKNGECEDDNKNVYVAEEAIKYFEPRYDTHEVVMYGSIEAENENRKENEKLSSNGHIVTIEFNRFEKFVRELMKGYEEDSYVEQLLRFDSNQSITFGYADRKSDVRYVHFCYYKKGEKFVEIYTDPVKEEEVLDMRSLYI